MSSAVQHGLIYLVQTIFDLYLFVLIIRLMLVWVRADYFNPLTQMTVRLTNVFIKPIRKVIPTIHNVEIATLIFIFFIDVIKLSLIIMISGVFLDPAGLLILMTADVLKLIVNTLAFLLLLYVIMGFIQTHSPVQRTLHQLVAPMIRPFQRLIPPVAGFDLSPIPAFILLQLINIVLVNPLLRSGF